MTRILEDGNFIGRLGALLALAAAALLIARISTGGPLCPVLSGCCSSAAHSENIPVKK